jgi:hypothetical protein
MLAGKFGGFFVNGAGGIFLIFRLGQDVVDDAEARCER